LTWLTLALRRRRREVHRERLANDTRVVTRFTVEHSFRNEHVDFRFAQLDHEAAQALPSAFSVQAHACGGS
jgi:hypothetical protein